MTRVAHPPLADQQRTDLQRDGEIDIDPRCTVGEVVDLLGDLGLNLGEDALLCEVLTMDGVGLRIEVIK